MDIFKSVCRPQLGSSSKASNVIFSKKCLVLQETERFRKNINRGKKKKYIFLDVTLLTEFHLTERIQIPQKPNPYPQKHKWGQDW